eukprot:CAMPEP_0175030024 /NCGR_PEP_ID=MMETSP0005-20121125/19962_1 /TAXON_ID=420556 /ORGANISM="Ochromonas sp., Strain CCMP1393" /LENGTH=39 /DNA_ID= /DNA_START= /DNA_END= /DNA_ORIENTATION=
MSLRNKQHFSDCLLVGPPALSNPPSALRKTDNAFSILSR